MKKEWGKCGKKTG